MTAQMHDRIVIDEKIYSIVGVNGSELFSPSSIGIVPVPTITSCWRGYVCQYRVNNTMLHLDVLQISHIADPLPRDEQKVIPQSGPAINGVRPKGDHPSFKFTYEGLNFIIPFTGTILAGDGFIQSLYVHMGFHPAWKYQTVLELTFSEGNVQGIRDVSVEMAQVRSKMTEISHKPDHSRSKVQGALAWFKKKFGREAP